jgi:hypothetical protein
MLLGISICTQNNRPTDQDDPDEMNERFIAYYRCPEEFAPFVLAQNVSEQRGYFHFGEGVTCYGNYRGSTARPVRPEQSSDALRETTIQNRSVALPFDPQEAARNLQLELYVENWRSGPLSLLTNLYYLIRPALSVRIRKHLQKFHLRNWRQIPFPKWPIDCSVDDLQEQLLLLALKASDTERIPFIWFWPEGAAASAVMTHDVESREGSNFCPTLMDLDDSFGIKASFQIVPEDRYLVRPDLLQLMRRRGFEIAVHDLNHDGHLFKNREQFLARAQQINLYGKEFGSEGFRAAVLYRKQVWFDALKFSFDMSVPNVAHLDPQRGGCCTVMPYFIGDLVEIPVTTIQDYSLFNILNDYTIDIWKQQCKIILKKHGCMNFIVHPDYVMQPREQGVYKELLSHLNQLRSERNLWITTPGEVNRWWRQRAAMKLVRSGQSWRIEGPGSERARIAFATQKEGRLNLSLESPPKQVQFVNAPDLPSSAASASAVAIPAGD